jgi:hypothetical protein
MFETKQEREKANKKKKTKQKRKRTSRNVKPHANQQPTNSINNYKHAIQLKEKKKCLKLSIVS